VLTWFCFKSNRLREEREAWEGLLLKKLPLTEKSTPQTNGHTIHPITLPSTLSLPSIPTLPSVELPESQTIGSPPSREIADSSTVMHNLDSLADSFHTFNRYRNLAERFAGKVIGEVADRLEDENRKVQIEIGTEMVDTGDVLRVLAGG
jgi:hypothetical protein